MQDFFDKKRKLNDGLEETKNCRVNASHRLNSNGSFSEFINVYYSVFTVILSIFSIFFKDVRYESALSMSATILSIALTISISYANSIKFKEKAQKAKDSYTSIKKLQYKLSNIKDNDHDALQNFEMEYTEILNEYDLHIPFDYHTYVCNKKVKLADEENNSINIKYKWHLLWTNIVRILLIVFPFIFVLISFCIENYVDFYKW